MGWLSSLKKAVPFVDPFDIFSRDDGGSEESIARPKYYEDPDYRAAQDALKGLGLGLLEGNVPDYYKPLGEMGSPQFESMLALSNRDIQKSAGEAMAASGRARGGSLPAVTAGAIADNAIKMRYEDFNRALAGRGDLLKLGTDVTTGVRSAGQTEGGNVNSFNWKDYQAQWEEKKYNDMMEAQRDKEMGELIGTIASIGMGMATGGMSFGLQGALAGGADVLTGGGTNFLGMLNKNPLKTAAGISELGSIGEQIKTPITISSSYTQRTGFSDEDRSIFDSLRKGK